MNIGSTPTQRVKAYNSLIMLRDDLKQGIIDDTKSELIQSLGIDVTQLQEVDFLQKIYKELHTLLMQIQRDEQHVQLHEQDIDRTKGFASPHLDDTLRSQWLADNLRYEDRLQFVFSPIDSFVKINKDYLESQKKILKKNGKAKNKGAIEAHFMKTFIEHFLVIDPDKITDDMRLYLFEGKSQDQLTKSILLSEVRKKLANPYFLQYEIPASIAEEKPTKIATSRIAFPKGTPAILVFQGEDSHLVVENPTKHEKTKIQKGMGMQITNSSYDVIASQYEAIKHITKDQQFVQSFFDQLQSMLQDKQLDADQKLTISQAIGSLAPQVNPHVLMARLYNLSRVENFKNKTVQQNLLLGAINKLGKREKELGQYLYYMVPQLESLQKLHDNNIENIQTLHRNILMCASGNNPRSFAADKRKQMEQFNKHDPLMKVEKALRQHPIEQKDHLIGMFYTMHQQVKKIFDIKDKESQKKYATILVYIHRFVLAAEQMKLDLKINKAKNIDQYFGEWEEYVEKHINETDKENYFTPFLEIIETVKKHIADKNIDATIAELAISKNVLEPKLED